MLTLSSFSITVNDEIHVQIKQSIIRKILHNITNNLTWTLGSETSGFAFFFLHESGFGRCEGIIPHLLVTGIYLNNDTCCRCPKTSQICVVKKSIEKVDNTFAFFLLNLLFCATPSILLAVLLTVLAACSSTSPSEPSAVFPIKALLCIFWNSDSLMRERFSSVDLINSRCCEEGCSINKEFLIPNMMGTPGTYIKSKH